MKSIAEIRHKSRLVRKKGLRRRVKGTNERPRLCVFRSNKFTYAQVISDESARVIVSASTRDIVEEGSSAKSVESAKLLGKRVAELVKEEELTKVVFDRNGYTYHGRVAAVAQGAREGGLEF